MSKRFHWTTKPDYMAECQDCPWVMHSRNALGTAARHHDSTGHKVRIGVESAVYYQTRESYDAERKKMGKLP
jgi:hypothetical protein